MIEHTVRQFDVDLQALTNGISKIGRLTERQIVDATDALLKHNAKLAQQVRVADAEIDVLQREIESKSVDVIARRQPVAGDLRTIVGVLRIAIDLERIGDIAVNIAKRTELLSNERWPKGMTIRLRKMVKLVIEQLRRVLDSYIRKDDAQALDVWQKDQEIDALNVVIFRQLLTSMLEDARNINLGMHLIFCAKNIERIGDHATNIAESVYYIAHGTTVPGERPKAGSV
jgi:phosphate transport system protein